jgi:death on curing protein
MAIEFLQIEDVLYIHQNQIDLYGGEHGVRDASLLDSAIAQPQASFGGNYLHNDAYAMAAAYLYHIVQNHPFIDGNKRTGAVAALTFLDWNDVNIHPDEDGLVDITLQAATHQADKKAIAEFFQTHAM